jgi:hypothetical protein
MPFRFRRSIRIAPGLQLNVGRRGVSASATLPGTGISYTLTTPQRCTGRGAWGGRTVAGQRGRPWRPSCGGSDGCERHHALPPQAPARKRKATPLARPRFIVRKAKPVSLPTGGKNSVSIRPPARGSCCALWRPGGGALGAAQGRVAGR